MVDRSKTLEWRREQFSLSYEVGDITLFARRLDGILCLTHFLNMREDGSGNCSEVFKEYGVRVAKITSCPISQTTPRLTSQEGVIVYNVSTYEHHYVNTQNGFEVYLSKFRSKTRSTLKRKVAKLFQGDREGNGLKRFKKAEEIERFLKLASVVSAKTYQHLLFNRGIPSDAEFVRNAMEKAEQGLLRGYLLYYEGKPIAYTYVPTVNPGVLLYDYNGYDPEYCKLSPGTVMQYGIIEDLCSDPAVNYYDLCVGQDDAKTLFSTDSIYCADILILENSLKNWAVVLTHMAVSEFSRRVGQILARMNLKARLRKYIRENVRTAELFPEEQE